MADDFSDVLRANETKAGLQVLLAKSRGRVPPAPISAVYTTLPDGRVQDRAGNVIFTPTPRQEKKP